MAKTHELGLSFKTIGKLVHRANWTVVGALIWINNRALHLSDTTFFESRWFWHVIRVDKGTPLHSRAYTGEIDGEFRQSNSHVLRFTPSRALVVGSWQPMPEELDETDMLYRATNLDHERADEQSTGFDAAVVGLPVTPADEGPCSSGSCGCK